MDQKLAKDLCLTELVGRTRTFFYLENCAKMVQSGVLPDDKVCKNDINDERLLVQTHIRIVAEFIME
jgi:hypothetical protein